MNFNNLKYKANYYTLLLLVFVIPLERRFAAPLIGLFLITSLINGDFKSKNKKNIFYFILLFIAYLVGLLYTENLKIGWHDIESKLSLIIFPIAFYCSKIDYKNKLNNILNSFIDGCLVAAIIELIYASIQYFFTLNISHFFYENIVLYTHPSYSAMFMCFSLIIVYYYFFTTTKTTFLGKLKLTFFLFIFSVMIFLFSSKTGIITLIFIHFISIIYWIIKGKFYVTGGISIAILCLIFGLVYTKVSPIKNRVNEMFAAITSKNKHMNSTTATRIKVWKATIKIIKKKPIIGYGTGDAKEALVKEYLTENLTTIAKERLNAHNQFLQTTVALGIVGGILLLLTFMCPIYFSFKNHYFIYASFLLLILFNFLTEAIIEREAGIVFYAVFNSLFFVSFFNQNNNQLN